MNEQATPSAGQRIATLRQFFQSRRAANGVGGARGRGNDAWAPTLWPDTEWSDTLCEAPADENG
jgi:hypothetical protein